MHSDGDILDAQRRNQAERPGVRVEVLSGARLFRRVLQQNLHRDEQRPGPAKVFSRHAGGFDETLERMEDKDLWLRLILSGHRMHYLDEPLVIYRDTAGSLSKNVPEDVPRPPAAGRQAGSDDGAPVALDAERSGCRPVVNTSTMRSGNGRGVTCKRAPTASALWYGGPIQLGLSAGLASSRGARSVESRVANVGPLPVHRNPARPARPAGPAPTSAEPPPPSAAPPGPPARPPPERPRRATASRNSSSSRRSGSGPEALKASTGALGRLPAGRTLRRGGWRARAPRRCRSRPRCVASLSRRSRSRERCRARSSRPRRRPERRRIPPW